MSDLDAYPIGKADRRPESPWDRHAFGVLQFSGGKDSLACLHLLRPYWDRLVVMWCNTGDAFPETINMMARIKDTVPRFVEVKSHQPAQVEKMGWPVDVIPVTRTPYGRYVDGHALQDFQPSMSCCGDNIWLPMHNAIKDMGATLIVRGTKVSDSRKSHIRDGMTEDGIEYHHPIEGWSDTDVMDYLRGAGVALPAHYEYVNTSLDCRHCTAYLYENAGKMRYMRVRHPVLYRDVSKRLQEIRAAVADELIHIETAVEA